MAFWSLIMIETWLIFSNSSCLINFTTALSSMSCGKKYFFLSFSVRDTSLQNPVSRYKYGHFSVFSSNKYPSSRNDLHQVSFLTDGYSSGQNERNLIFSLMLRLIKT